MGRRASRRSSGGSSTACDPRGTTCGSGAWNALRRRFELSPRPGTPEANAVRGARRRRGAARQAHARRQTVRRPLPGRGGAAEGRADHAVPAGAVVGPPRSLRDHGDGRRGGARLRRAGRGGSRSGPSPATGSSTAAARGDGRDGGRARIDGSFSSATPNGAIPPRRSSPVRSSPPTAASCRAGRASRPTSARRAAASRPVRRTGSFAGFILDVVGPESIPGCATRRDDHVSRQRPAPRSDTAVNEPGRSGLAGPDGAVTADGTNGLSKRLRISFRSAAACPA